MDDCSSVLLNIMGHPSFQAAMATVVIFQIVLCTPADTGGRSLKLHAWLQETAWVESDVQPKLSKRPFQGEPCFCFETTLKLFYYCKLIYAIEENPDSEMNVDVALGLYGLNQHMLLWKKKLDAKCLVTWNTETKTIVLAFRGTASMANVLSDIEVWRSAYPPIEGSYFLGTQPMVHRGFSATWQGSGLRDDVMELLKEIIGAAPPDAQWRILTTGHSLGAALSHLASYDIARQQELRVKLTCVTFGAPRPGNHAFAHNFRRYVPDAWDIFHADDAVSQSGKFIFMYKRAAHTVIVSKRGELIVRPTYAEMSARRSFTPSLKEHLLSSYARSLGEIIRSEVAQGAKASRLMGSMRGKGSIADDLQALKGLLACTYVQTCLTTSGAMRQVSLLRITGASASRIERAETEATLPGKESKVQLGCGQQGCGGSLFKRAVQKVNKQVNKVNPLAYNEAELELNVRE